MGQTSSQKPKPGRQHTSKSLQAHRLRVTESTSALQQGFLSLETPLLFTDQEGNITSANIAMLRLTEYAELVGQNVEILMPPESAQHHSEYMARYLKTQVGNVIGNGGRMVPLITKSGKRKTTMLSIGEVRNGFIASLMDLTPSMRLQEEKTRTAEAERAVDERSQFLSFLNHELRVPMNALSLAIALLNEKRNSSNACVEAYEQHLNDMRSCCDQIVHLLNDVLDIERMRADVYKYEYGPADMTQLVTKAKNISIMSCGKKVRGIDFLVNVSPVFQTYRLWCDEQRLLQVLINFITVGIEELIGTGPKKKQGIQRDSGVQVKPQVVVSVNCTWRDPVSTDNFLQTEFRVGDEAVPIDLSMQVWFTRAITQKVGRAAQHAAAGDGGVAGVVERTREKPVAREEEEKEEEEEEGKGEGDERGRLHSPVTESKMQNTSRGRCLAASTGKSEVDEARAYIDTHLYTPTDETNSYMGLGLAIAREIIEKGHFGTVHRWTKQSTTTLEARISAFVVPGTYAAPFRSIGLADALNDRENDRGSPAQTRDLSVSPSSLLSSDGGDSDTQHEDEAGEPGSCDVLYVEDNALNRRVVSELLHVSGFSTRLCENGRFAIEWFATPGNQCKVVVMDRSMPEVNGEQATRQILSTHPQQKIIGLTGDTEARHVRNMKEAGALRVLNKPVSHQELVRVIREVIDQPATQKEV